MKLSSILDKIKNQQSVQYDVAVNGEIIADLEIDEVTSDSRKCSANCAFFILPSYSRSTIHQEPDFIKQAVTNGAKLVVAESFSAESLQLCKANNAVAIKTDKVFPFLVKFLQIFYAPLPTNIYAVTGTNGKTSSAEFIRQILNLCHKKSASVGTLGIVTIEDVDGLEETSLTTPDIASLYRNLHILKKNNIDDVAMETSSIGLVQERMAGINIGVGAFTNFTQDHLDYHKTMEEYFRCKSLLFSQDLESGSYAVLNADIAEYDTLQKICQARNIKVLDYGYNANYLKLISAQTNSKGQEIVIEFTNKISRVQLSVVGEFQVMNILCALACVAAKIDIDEVMMQNLLKNFDGLKPAAGRMQLVTNSSNEVQILIDYAHTPDAMDNALRLSRKMTKNRVLVLFGCGGNRDSKKRAMMGRIASMLADIVIVTDDNPRKEDAAAIRAEILSNCDERKTIEIADRKAAIKEAITMLESGDLLLIAGKGHEKYQIIGEQKFEFDEEKIVKSFIK